MKILLDNCLDIHAKSLFPGHEVQHVLDLRWESFSNGKLLAAAAAAGFAVMVTVDKNIRYQQNLDRLPIAVIEFDVVKNRMDEVAKLAPFIAMAIQQAGIFRFVSIKVDGAMECLVKRASTQEHPRSP